MLLPVGSVPGRLFLTIRDHPAAITFALAAVSGSRSILGKATSALRWLADIVRLAWEVREVPEAVLSGRRPYFWRAT